MSKLINVMGQLQLQPKLKSGVTAICSSYVIELIFSDFMSSSVGQVPIAESEPPMGKFTANTHCISQ